MKKNQLNQLFNKNPLSKLVLILTLIFGVNGSAWAQKSLPYEYGFENNDLAGEGWTTSGTSSSAIYSVSSSYSAYISDANHKYLYRFYGATGDLYLISPELSTTTYGTNVSFYYNSFSSTQSRTFSVGYSTTNNDVENFNFTEYNITYTENGWKQFNGTFPSTTKYIAIKHEPNSQYQPFFIDDIGITASTPYFAPTDFSLSSYSATTATFSWTNGSSETAWDIEYSTKEDLTESTIVNFTTANLVNGKYILSGLTENETYYARLRAKYDGENNSDWTEKISFTPKSELNTPINVGTQNNSNAPINGNNIKNNLIRSQFIIPSSNIEAIKGRQITKITFLAKNYENWDLEGATFEVYLKDVGTTAAFESVIMDDWGVKVYNSATLSISDYNMEIVFDTPYNYNGGNLKIGIKQTTNATSAKYGSWYGISSTAQSLRYSTDDQNAEYGSFAPQVTITSIATTPVQIGENGYSTFAFPAPLDLTTENLPDGLTAWKAAIDGTTVNFNEINQTVAANTGMLLKGTADQTYYIPVANSGTTPDGNAFQVNSTGGTFEAAASTNYFGMMKNSNPLVFGVFDPSTVAIPTNKAYLTAPSASARELTCVFNETTGIEKVESRERKVESYYDLTGRRVANPTKGLYIVNGKKVVVK